VLAGIGGGTGCTRSGSSGSKADPNTLYLELSADPATLNPITSSDYYASLVQGYIFNSLMDRSEDTYGWIPSLAEKYEISKDGKSFTFTLREGVKWHDGQPLTAEDVKYSFDVYFEGRFDAPQMKVYLEGIREVKILDPRTVQFITKQVYFKNRSEEHTSELQFPYPTLFRSTSKAASMPRR